MTVKEIDEQIFELRKQRQEIMRREVDEHQELARQHVGRCFKINGSKYAKVIGVPAVIHTKTGVEYNEYQYPALYLGYDIDLISRRKPVIPFYEDNLFSAAWGEGNDFLNAYEEVSPEEFATVFEEKLADFKNQIGV